MIEIERLEFIEEKMEVKLESLFANQDGRVLMLGVGYYKEFVVNGELHTIDDSYLNQNIRLVASAHDSSSRVLGSGSIEIQAKEFFGFDIFSVKIPIYACEDLITKVRIYPTPSRYA